MHSLKITPYSNPHLYYYSSPPTLQFLTLPLWTNSCTSFFYPNIIILNLFILRDERERDRYMELNEYANFFLKIQKYNLPDQRSCVCFSGHGVRRESCSKLRKKLNTYCSLMAPVMMPTFAAGRLLLASCFL